VAVSAAFVAAVFFDELAFGEFFGGVFIVGERGDVFGRAREFFAEEDLGDPVAAKDGTGAGGTGLFGESG